jgi:hypothetical protein
MGREYMESKVESVDVRHGFPGVDKLVLTQELIRASNETGTSIDELISVLIVKLRVDFEMQDRPLDV